MQATHSSRRETGVVSPSGGGARLSPASHMDLMVRETSRNTAMTSYVWSHCWWGHTQISFQTYPVIPLQWRSPQEMVPGPFLVAHNPSLLSILLHFLHDVTSVEKRPLIGTLRMIVRLGPIPLVYSVYVLLWVQKGQNSTSSSWYLCPGYWSHRPRSTGWTLVFSSRNIENTWSMLNLVFMPFHITH